MLGPRAQVAVAAGFAVLVLAAIGLAVYLLTGLGSGSDGTEVEPAAQEDDVRATCQAFADALEPVVPLLTPVAPTANDPVRGEAVQSFFAATDGLELDGWFDSQRVVIGARMGLLAFAPEDDAEYAQRYADYRAALADLADTCRVAEVPIPQPLPA